MSISAVLSYAAAYFSVIVMVSVLLSNRRSFVHLAFAAGLLLLAGEEMLRGFSYGAVLPADVIYWQKRVVAVSLFIPAVWLAFSISYARANFQSSLSRWKWTLIAAG